MKRRALLSVSDKTGLVEFAQGLAELGFELISTGGTHGALCAAGLEVREIQEVTEFPEMMDGRVKTLHPRVHGGLLALRDDPAHREAMEAHGIRPIDLVVVNLYPFERTVTREGVGRAEAIEQIDIGGPSMVRSAAKNHRYVGVVTDPGQYGRVLSELREHGGELPDALRRELALAAFELTARYDAAIARWLFTAERAEGSMEEEFPASFALTGTRLNTLRYGENPHQRAALYRGPDFGPATLAGARVLGGKELSYNNLVDLEAALRLAREFEAPFACVIKHNNPCGAATGRDLAEALERAWAGDPVSAFGSVLAFTRPLDAQAAEFLVSEQRFVEAIVAPAYAPDALTALTTRPKWGKNVRLLEIGTLAPVREEWQVRPISGGFLVQTSDARTESREDCRLGTDAAPSREQLEALLFAAAVGKHVGSNAIVLARPHEGGAEVVGVGAGQMSRVDSVRIALEKAGPRARGAVLASDAFFPFPDGVELALSAGVAAFLQPGGSVRDEAVLDTCRAAGAPMLLTGTRHFRH